MNILLQELSTPFASVASHAEKIIMPNGDIFSSENIPEHIHKDALVLGLLQKTVGKPSWKISSTEHLGKKFPAHKIILEHTSQANTILCTTSHAKKALHESSHAVDFDGTEIPITSSLRAKMLALIKKYSSEGNFLTGASIQNIERSNNSSRGFGKKIFLAIGLYPYAIHNDARRTLHDMRKNQTSVRLFSEQHIETCRSIAKQLGIPWQEEHGITSDQLQSMHDDEVRKILDDIYIFAEMENLDAYRIMRLFEERGNTVIHPLA